LATVRRVPEAAEYALLSAANSLNLVSFSQYRQRGELAI